MRKNALLPMVLLLATAGCACIGSVEIPDAKGQRQPADKRAARFCAAEVCKVTVHVDENCTVRVDPYYLVMAGRGHTRIEWTIDGGTFLPDSIRWKQAGAGDVLQLSREVSSSRQVTFTNNRKIGWFNYGVTVKRGERTCPELDPTVINDWP